MGQKKQVVKWVMCCNAVHGSRDFDTQTAVAIAAELQWACPLEPEAEKGAGSRVSLVKQEALQRSVCLGTFRQGRMQAWVSVNICE